MLKRLGIVWVLGSLFAWSLAGDQIVVPHLAADGGSFANQLVFENRGTEARDLYVIGYGAEGFAASVNLELEPASRLELEATDLFPGESISHLFLDSHPGVYAGVAYIPRANPDNRTFVEGVQRFSQRWRVFPSNWRQTFDGMVVVNPTCVRADLRLEHRSTAGVLLDVEEVEGGLLGYAKRLFVLSQLFEQVEGSYVELISDLPVASMGLKGSLNTSDGTSFLVGNQAERYPIHENLTMALAQHRTQWQSSELSSAYRITMQRLCFCPVVEAVDVVIIDGRTELLTYTDSGLDVPLDEIKEYYSIEELFEHIETLIARQPERLEVRFDEDTGAPVQVNVDWNLCTADDEFQILVTHISAVER